LAVLVVCLAAASPPPSAQAANPIVTENTQPGTSAWELGTEATDAGGTRFQKAAGVEDSPEQTAADILAKNRNGSDPAVTLALCRRPETHGLPAHPRQHLWRSLHPRREGA